MKITVITVCFNAEKTIADTLDSIAAQTHPDVEHIVVDGASTDGTLEVIRARGGRVAKVISEPDAGIFDAMNKGLRAATGDLIGFLHADDVYADPAALARMAALAEESGADVLLGDVLMVKGENRETVVRDYSVRDFSLEWFSQGDTPPHPGFYHKADIIARFGDYDTDFRYAGDYEFLARILRKGGASYVILRGPPMVRMLMGGASNSSPLAPFRMLKEVYRGARRNGIALRPDRVARKYVRKLNQFLGAARAQRGAAA